MNSPYGVTKIAGEHYCQFYAAQYNIHYSVLRYSNVYGPRQSVLGEAGVVAIFCNQLLKGEQPVIFCARTPGDGGGSRDYIFVQDVVRANLKILTACHGEILNISTGVGTTTETLYRMIAEIMGIKIEPKSAAPRIGDVEKSVMDSRRAQTLLNWRPDISLYDGLEMTVAFYQS